MGNPGNVICECCQTYSDDHQVEGKKSFTDSASGPFIIDPLKLLFAMLNLRVFEIGFVV